MRVLNVVNSLGPGGIETLLLRVWPLLKDRGVQVDVCCTSPKAMLEDPLEAYGARIYRIPKSANCYDTASRIAQIASRGYDLVHSHFGYTSGGIALGASQASKPILVSVHNSAPLALYAWRTKPGFAWLRNAWLSWHRRLMLRHTDAFLCHSDANLAAFVDSLGEARRCRTLTLGVEGPPASLPTKEAARQSLGLQCQGPVLLHVGSFLEKKNHVGLLQIFKQVLRSEPLARLALVGDGPLRPSIADAAARLGVLDRVHFVGATKRVWPWYAAADVFVFPSKVEGFGLALVEAQLAGLPVVASDIPPHRESVAAKQHRFLFAPGDYRQAASLALSQLESARDGSGTWIAESRDYAKREFSIDRYAEEVASAYQSSIQQAA